MRPPDDCVSSTRQRIGLSGSCIMSYLDDLALRTADQARTDFAALETELEVIQISSRIPTRAYFCRMLFLASASIWALPAVLLLIR